MGRRCSPDLKLPHQAKLLGKFAGHLFEGQPRVEIFQVTLDGNLQSLGVQLFADSLNFKVVEIIKGSSLRIPNEASHHAGNASIIQKVI
jgi:hypothetical protein